jgi:putative membrane protein
MITIGIAYHVQFMLGLRHERRAMTAAGLIHGKSVFPPSLTLITAAFLWLIGLLAVSSMIFRAGPFE